MKEQLTHLTNATMQQSNISQYTILWQKCAQICTFLFENGAFCIWGGCIVGFVHVNWTLKEWKVQCLSIYHTCILNLRTLCYFPHFCSLEILYILFPEAKVWHRSRTLGCNHHFRCSGLETKWAPTKHGYPRQSRGPSRSADMNIFICSILPVWFYTWQEIMKYSLTSMVNHTIVISQCILIEIHKWCVFNTKHVSISRAGRSHRL